MVDSLLPLPLSPGRSTPTSTATPIVPRLDLLCLCSKSTVLPTRLSHIPALKMETVVRFLLSRIGLVDGPSETSAAALKRLTWAMVCMISSTLATTSLDCWSIFVLTVMTTAGQALVLRLTSPLELLSSWETTISRDCAGGSSVYRTYERRTYGTYCHDSTKEYIATIALSIA